MDSAAKPIKVLFFTNANTSRMVAQDLNAKDIIRHFDAPFEVYLFNSGPGEIDPKCMGKNVHIIDINTPWQKLKWFKFVLFEKVDYHFYIRSYQPRSYWWFKKLVGNRAKTIHPVEITLPYPDNDAYQKKARRNALNSDYLFGLTDLIIESIKEEYGVETTGKIPIGVDTTVFYPQKCPRESDRVRVISVGSLQERKRPLFFVETAKHFPDVDFVWIGGGALKEQVLEKAQKEQIKNFQLLDPMPHKELAVEMNRSDIFYFPSLHEGLPKVIVEAMACGLPAIAFDAYKPEHVQDGLSGFVVNSDEMAQSKLRLLIEDPQMRASFSAAAIKRANAFSWKRVAQMWKDFLREESGR